MCGIAGIRSVFPIEATVATAMAMRLAHRGPDDAGVWADEETGIALAHRRLAVVDLSPAGHQPMQSHCGRYVLAFNGEIYNHRDLRCWLDGEKVAPPWRGHSDTETLLAAITAWGIGRVVAAAVGMFAFSLWDRQSRELTLVRDRIGEKPLYYGWLGKHFVFASELKALRAVPGFDGEIDRNVLALYMRHGYVPAPYSIYRGIFKLPAGTMLTLTATECRTAESPVPEAYWSARDVALAGVRQPRSFASTAAAIDALEGRLRNSVGDQMVADVPLGAFLSGGVDSSAVVAMMQAAARERGWPAVKTFTIGFAEAAYNEADHARAVAAHLGTDHAEHIIDAREALDVIPSLPQLYDEPFADSSQIPTYLVSRFARERVTVALSGDGGDELFGGYNRHVHAAMSWPRIARIPRPLRTLLGKAMLLLSPQAWDGIHDVAAPLIPHRLRLSQAGNRLHKAALLLGASDGRQLYRSLVSHWSDLVAGSTPLPSLLDDEWPAMESLAAQMMLMDLRTYLSDDILVKSDRAAMSVSLETRMPFLDHRVVEFAWQLPQDYKLRDGNGKWLLRQVLYRHVPQALIERPKTGFGIPLDQWLRGPLREWADAMLDEGVLRQQGYFDVSAIRSAWAEHLAGRRNRADHLWDVLMFQAWLEKQN